MSSWKSSRIVFLSRVFGCAAVSFVMTQTDPAAAGEARPAEHGYAYGEFENARTLAMGGAARAFGWSTPAVSLNPANVNASRVYHVEGLFGIDTNANRLQYGAAVVDSVTSALGLGFLVNRTTLGNSDDPVVRGGTDVRVSAAYSLSPRVHLGLTGRYLRISQDGVGPLGSGRVSREQGDDPSFRTLTFDAGLSVLVTESVRLGAVGYNLTNTGSVLAPLMAGGGLGLKISDVTVEANVLGVDKTVWGAWKSRVMIGAEILVADRFPIRAGYTYDQGAKRHAFSAGFGYVEKAFGIDASFRREVSVPDDPWGKALVFVLGLRYFYESAAPDSGGSSF